MDSSDIVTDCQPQHPYAQENVNREEDSISFTPFDVIRKEESKVSIHGEQAELPFDVATGLDSGSESGDNSCASEDSDTIADRAAVGLTEDNSVDFETSVNEKRLQTMKDITDLGECFNSLQSPPLVPRTLPFVPPMEQNTIAQHFPLHTTVRDLGIKT